MNPLRRTPNSRKAVAAFLQSRMARGLSARTLEWYAYALSPLTTTTRLPRKPAELEALLAQVQGSPSTRHAFWRALTIFYRWAHSRLGVPDAAADLPPPKQPHRLPPSLSHHQVDQLLALRTPRRNRAILTLFLDTGLRLGELASLTWPHIGTETITVDGKTGQRQVPVSPETLRLLIGLGGPEAVWTCPARAGHPLTRNSIQRMTRRALRRIGVRGGPHLLRHTFARLYVTAGGDVFSLQRILGHTEITMTRRYADLDMRDIAAQHQQFSPIARRAAGVE